jgi:hypothetical protein
MGKSQLGTTVSRPVASLGCALAARGLKLEDSLRVYYSQSHDFRLQYSQKYWRSLQARSFIRIQPA